MAKPKKTKALAIPAPQSKDECIAMITELGNCQREVTREETHMNDLIAAAREESAEKTTHARERMAQLESAIQAWCETNRHDLTGGGKVKHADLIAGMVYWRTAPPSVRVTNAAKVIAALRGAGYIDFIRSKQEIDKDAMLANPERAREITGVTIKSVGETFAIEVKEDALING